MSVSTGIKSGSIEIYDLGLLLTGPVTRNTIEETNIHLCRNHVQIGGPDDAVPNDNRIEAFMDSQGIEPTTGARVFGSRNLLVLSTRGTPRSEDLAFEESAAQNVALLHGPLRTVDRTSRRSNRVLSPGAGRPLKSPPVPAAGQACRNEFSFPVEVRFVKPGRVRTWSEQADDEAWVQYDAGLRAGQSLVLNPGDRVRFEYDEPPTWRWKPIR